MVVGHSFSSFYTSSCSELIPPGALFSPPDVSMGVDPMSPIAPARLRALLLPIGKIKRSRFLSFSARLQSENVVRLGDISPDARPNRSR